LVKGDPVALTGNAVAAYGWVAVSLDLVPADGSVWVAERASSTETGTIHHYDAGGAEIPGDQHSWDASPFCIRVNPYSGDVWVADSKGISRIDSGGNVRPVESSAAWWSMAIDPVSGIVWVIGGIDNTNLDTYAPDGTRLSTMGGFSTSQKWVTFVR
jgi:hypothetical protein